MKKKRKSFKRWKVKDRIMSFNILKNNYAYNHIKDYPIVCHIKNFFKEFESHTPNYNYMSQLYNFICDDFSYNGLNWGYPHIKKKQFIKLMDFSTMWHLMYVVHYNKRKSRK